MAKHNSAETTFEEQKEKLFEAIEDLKNSLDLSDEEMKIVKEWGVTLLVTGVSVFIAYRILKKLFGTKKNMPVLGTTSSGNGRYVREASPVSRMVKEQLALFLIAFFRKRLVKFLEAKGLLNEDEDI